MTTLDNGYGKEALRIGRIVQHFPAQVRSDMEYEI
jgi:hypothetical protein